MVGVAASSFTKSVWRSIRGSLGRFLAITGIVALGCGFLAGLQMSGRDMRLAADRSLEEAMVEGILFTVNELMEQRLMVAVESIQAYNDAILLLETQKEQME